MLWHVRAAAYSSTATTVLLAYSGPALTHSPSRNLQPLGVMQPQQVGCVLPDPVACRCFTPTHSSLMLHDTCRAYLLCHRALCRGGTTPQHHPPATKYHLTMRLTSPLPDTLQRAQRYSSCAVLADPAAGQQECHQVQRSLSMSMSSLHRVGPADCLPHSTQV
mmetsp:Transcript_21341/g.46628  ORF Transcript_21341/g.46628 Transcript_21341/m.46628 type:complete len:163 (-) Transcript_21341:449-937(-)